MKKFVYCLLPARLLSLILVAGVSIFFSPLCFAQKLDTISAKQPCLILQGNYKGENIYIQNPFAGKGLNFCVTSVFVNRTKIDTIKYPRFEMYTNAFEIDLKGMGFKIGDTLYIQIYHKQDCRPKVLNPCMHCGTKSTFDIVKIEASPDGTLKWTAKNENTLMPFVIEIFRWNKWVKVGEVDAIGGTDENSYVAKVVAHSGENKIRVKQVDYTSQPRTSKSVGFVSNAKYLTYSPKLVDSKLNLSGETMYEVYDKDGNIVKKGFGKQIDCKKLPRGHYYLNYDNSTGEFDII